MEILQSSNNRVHRNNNAIVITVLYEMNYKYIKLTSSFVLPIKYSIFYIL